MVAAALACAAVLVACGGGGGSAPAPPPVVAATPTPTPIPTATPAGAPTLHTVLTWSGAAHSAGTATAPEPLEVAVPTSVTTAAGATTAVLRAYAADPAGSPVPSAQTVNVTLADGALASVAAIAPASRLNPDDVASVTGAGSVSGTTTVTVTAPGASPTTLPVNVYASLGVETNPSRDASFAWTLQNGALAPVATAAAADVYVATDRTSNTTFVFPYGFQALPASTAFASVRSATSFAPAGSTAIAAATIATSPASYGIILFKTKTGEYVKARLIQATCLGADRTRCDGGATLDAIALPSSGGLFPY
ncbi:MAG: hypothetical protein NVS3B7_16960 [Candidatus Elarobacter sp.]